MKKSYIIQTYYVNGFYIKLKFALGFHKLNKYQTIWILPTESFCGTRGNVREEMEYESTVQQHCSILYYNFEIMMVLNK